MGYLVVAVVLLLLPLAVARPFAGAVVFTAVAYLRPQNLAGGIAMEVRLSLLVLLATLAGLAIALVRGTEKPRLKSPWFAMVVALAGLFWIASTYAVFPALARIALIEFVKTLAGVAVTVALCTTPARIRAILFTAVLSLSAMAVISLVNPVWDNGRLTGAGGDFRDSNDFALALCMALPLLLCGWRAAPRKMLRAVMLALVPVVLVAIVLTQSRGGFLALAAMLGTWALFTRGRVFKLALAPAAVFAFLAFSPPAYLNRLTTLHNYSHDSSARDRISSWKVAWRIAEDRPLTGVGPGNFLAVYDRYANDFRAPHVAHNTPLQILANAGVPALVLFSAILLYGIAVTANLARRARTRIRLSGGAADPRESLESIDALATGIALAIVAYAVGSQFLSRDQLELFYLLTGLAGAMAMQSRGVLGARSTRSIVRGRVVLEGSVSCALDG